MKLRALVGATLISLGLGLLPISPAGGSGLQPNVGGPNLDSSAGQQAAGSVSETLPGLETSGSPDVSEPIPSIPGSGEGQVSASPPLSGGGGASLPQTPSGGADSGPSIGVPSPGQGNAVGQPSSSPGLGGTPSLGEVRPNLPSVGNTESPRPDMGFIGGVGVSQTPHGDGHSTSAEVENTKEESLARVSPKLTPAQRVAVEKAADRVSAASKTCLEFVIERTAALRLACKPASYIIRFASGVDTKLEAGLLRRSSVDVDASFQTAVPAVVATLDAQSLLSVAGASRVLSIEVDSFIQLASVDEGPVWGLDRLDQQSLPLSSTFLNPMSGSGVRVFIVDSGILSSHREFGQRVSSGFSAVDDGLGTTDCNGHGTHVAATVAGSTSGVVKQATLVPVRVMACNGSGLLSGLLAGLDWIATQFEPNDPVVINLSLSTAKSDALNATIRGLTAKGATVVVAAGNQSVNACDRSPASAPEAITVGASGRDDRFASFSNFGPCLDVVAPGVGVRSAAITSNEAFVEYNGTSMAAPHVSGLVAGLLSVRYLTPGQVEAALKGFSAINQLTEVPPSTSNLIVQIFGSVPQVSTNPVDGSFVVLPTEPLSPSRVTSRVWKDAARVTWTIAPNGGTALTRHIVRVWQNGRLLRAFSVSGSSSTARVTKLRYGIPYTFTVLAENSVGRSGDSNVIASVVPRR